MSSCPPSNIGNWLDTIERFELSFLEYKGGSKTEIVRREIIDRKGRVISLHLGLLKLMCCDF